MFFKVKTIPYCSYVTHTSTTSLS